MIERTKTVCEKSGHDVNEHFAGIVKSSPCKMAVNELSKTSPFPVMPANGLKAKDIKERKCPKKNQDILDYVGSTELGVTMLEDLPTPNKSVRQIEKELSLIE